MTSATHPSGRTVEERDLSFVLEATRLLANSLDIETTLANVARLSLPHLGSWCMVDLREGEQMRRLAIIHPDPDKQAEAGRLLEGWPPLREDRGGVPSVMESGRSQIVDPVTDEMLIAAAGSADNLDTLRALEIGSFMTIPMVARAEVLGVITYISAKSGNAFTEMDLALGEDLASRAAIAIDNSRLMRRAQVALTAAELSEERFSRIIAISAEAIISIDESQRVSLFNEGAEQIFGYARAEVIGQPLTILLPPRARQIHESHVVAFGMSSEIARRMGERHEICGLRKNGEEFPAEASISKLEVGGERIYTVVLRDITEARKAAAVQERLLDAVTEATEARSRLIRGVTHDVKNPLGAADGFAQLLEMELKSKLSPEQVKLVAGVRRGIHSALEIITDLLDLSQLESVGLSVTTEVVDIAELAAEAVEDHRGVAEATGHALFWESRTKGPVPLHVAPGRVRQIIGNLLTNAIKYTPAPGRIRVWLEPHVVAGGSRAGEWILINVQDNGSGIPVEDRELIFGEFHRLNPGERATGHGLGLAISRRVARILGGDLTVTSEVGEGATFTLWLPAHLPKGS